MVRLTDDSELTYHFIFVLMFIYLDSFCSGDCVPSGLFNVSSCRFGAPVFMSFPHFYSADPFYREQVGGMNPDKDKHEFFVALEPVNIANIALN